MQRAGLPVGLSKPSIGSVADSGNVLIHAAFSGRFAERRTFTSLQVIGKRGTARSIEQRPQMCVSTNAASEAVAIGLPKCIDADVASFHADLAALPAAFTSIIAARSLFFSSLALAGSFFWHATLNFDSSEPEPYNQPRIGFDLRPHSGRSLNGLGMSIASRLNAQRPSVRITSQNALLKTVHLARWASRRLQNSR